MQNKKTKLAIVTVFTYFAPIQKFIARLNPVKSQCDKGGVWRPLPAPLHLPTSSRNFLTYITELK
jgi:hypothetical protein